MANGPLSPLQGGRALEPPWANLHPADEAYEIATERVGGCVLARVSGKLHIDQFLSTLHILGIESEDWPEEVMLIDLTTLHATFPREDLLRIGQEIAASFVHMHRLALLVLPHRVTRISERSARRTGMDLRVFDSEAKAFEWLAGRHASDGCV